MAPHVQGTMEFGWFRSSLRRLSTTEPSYAYPARVVLCLTPFYVKSDWDIWTFGFAFARARKDPCRRSILRLYLVPFLYADVILILFMSSGIDLDWNGVCCPLDGEAGRYADQSAFLITLYRVLAGLCWSIPARGRLTNATTHGVLDTTTSCLPVLKTRLKPAFTKSTRPLPELGYGIWYFTL